MKGYKGFNANLSCRGFQYEVGKVYEMDDLPIICERGFHFCERLSDVLAFYCDPSSRYCEVEAFGEITWDNNPFESRIKKYATNKIKILRELTIDDIVTILSTEKHVTNKMRFE